MSPPMLAGFWLRAMSEPCGSTSSSSSQNGNPPACFSFRHRGTGAAIEGILMVWLTWAPDDLRNQVRWLR